MEGPALPIWAPAMGRYSPAFRIASTLEARRERGPAMAALKPRTGDGPLEVTKEGRGIIMRMPVEGGGRIVIEMTPDEARDLGSQLSQVAG